MRQAIAHAIDRKFVVDTIFLGYAAEATGPVPKNAPAFYSADVATYDFDVEKAKALLDEAGFPAGTDGMRFRLNLLPAPYFSETRQFGDYLRQALAAVGIDADHRGERQRRPPEGGLYRPRVRPRHRTHGLPRRSGDLDDDPRALRHSGGRALLEPRGLRERGARPGDRRSSRHPRPGEAGRALRRVPAPRHRGLPLINVADWSFTSVASDKVENIASNPRWAVSNWADTGLSE